MHRRRPLAPLLAALALLVPAAGAAAAPGAPALQSPAAGAAVQALPSFRWRPVRGAAEYEFQLAADRRFGSIVLGTGAGKGAFRTGNTAATLDRTIPDGDYFWRARAVGPGGTAGRWSAVRALAKRWSAAPQLVAPTDDLTVSWPLAPLALQWTAVAHAVKYQVAIATDPAL
ncbi:MAG TPA: hypothetical protein VLA98_05360, partial [Solirubrobacteraceae bacterium]|nr:hypothetical protein [Solirubrobacteraceae bacterium]